MQHYTSGKQENNVHDLRIIKEKICQVYFSPAEATSRDPTRNRNNIYIFLNKPFCDILEFKIFLRPDR